MLSLSFIQDMLTKWFHMMRCNSGSLSCVKKLPLENIVLKPLSNLGFQCYCICVRKGTIIWFTLVCFQGNDALYFFLQWILTTLDMNYLTLTSWRNFQMKLTMKLLKISSVEEIFKESWPEDFRSKTKICFTYLIKN